MSWSVELELEGAFERFEIGRIIKIFLFNQEIVEIVCFNLLFQCIELTRRRAMTEQDRRDRVLNVRTVLFTRYLSFSTLSAWEEVNY